MSLFAYITADLVGQASGGGRVTAEESLALREHADSLSGSRGVAVFDRLVLPNNLNPFQQDEAMLERLKLYYDKLAEWPKVVHLYAGCFTKTVAYLKLKGCKIAYTVAAHSVETSRRIHEEVGVPFCTYYPHLCDPEKFKEYVGGYLSADVVVVPSRYSERVVRGQGYAGRIEVIPHGVDLPAAVGTPPEKFIVGYLGAYAPDKGVRYLLEAWSKLAYSDALLVLAGRDSTTAYVKGMVVAFGGGAVELRGWVDSVSDFYNSISLYVQPSATEGFGIEVLEAAAHGRTMLCSDGAGAVDFIQCSPTKSLKEIDRVGCVVRAGDSDDLAVVIQHCRDNFGILKRMGENAREEAKGYEWSLIRGRYRELWKGLA